MEQQIISTTSTSARQPNMCQTGVVHKIYEHLQFLTRVLPGACPPAVNAGRRSTGEIFLVWRK